MAHQFSKASYKMVPRVSKANYPAAEPPEIKSEAPAAATPNFRPESEEESLDTKRIQNPPRNPGMVLR